MNQPLKNKKIVDIGFDGSVNAKINIFKKWVIKEEDVPVKWNGKLPFSLFKDKDIKSATEWLKKEIKQADKNYCDGKLSNYYYELIKKIEEAFPDLYPLKKRGT